MATAKQGGWAEPVQPARDVCATATNTIERFRCGGVACDIHKTEKALRGAFLDIHSSDESTIHPANVLLIQALQDSVQSARDTNEHCSHMLDCWASELEKDAEMVCQGEKGRKYMFILNNTCDVLQTMRRPEATFANAELVSRLSSMIQRHKESYLDECWVPLKNTLHFNLNEFTAEIVDTCGNQRIWKVTAELRYKLREEIVDLIVQPYEVCLSALQANRNRLSGVLCSFGRVIAGNKTQKKYTSEELQEEIKALFEG